MRARVVDIVDAASKMSGYPVSDIVGPRRFYELKLVRFACYAIARDHGHSFPMIGNRMGGRDHSSVLHGARQALNYASRDKDYAQFLIDLRERSDDGPIIQFVPRKPIVNKSRPVRVEAIGFAQGKPRNNFNAPADEKDGSHHFHDAIAKGSKDMAAALKKAMGA